MDTAVTKAYQSLLLLTIRQPDNVEYLGFADDVKLRSRRDYGYQFGHDEVCDFNNVQAGLFSRNCKFHKGLMKYIMTSVHQIILALAKVS
jgi:hypothetical protein